MSSSEPSLKMPEPNTPETDMPRFKVTAIMETDLSLIVEADSSEEVLDIAEQTDGAEFAEDGAGDWRITGAEIVE